MIAMHGIVCQSHYFNKRIHKPLLTLRWIYCCCYKEVLVVFWQNWKRHNEKKMFYKYYRSFTRV